MHKLMHQRMNKSVPIWRNFVLVYNFLFAATII